VSGTPAQALILAKWRTKMTSSIRKNDTKYTPAMRQQMLEAILKYGRENDIKWEIFHYRIKAAIGLDDNDTRLHSSDPRHWVNGRVPNDSKLDLYAKFIKKVYPDFEFSDSMIKNYISIGDSLWRFSARENTLSEPKLRKQAKSLHRKFFRSEICMGLDCQGLGILDDLYASSLMTFRAIDNSPYLLAYKFNYQYAAREMNAKNHPRKHDVLLEVGGLEIIDIHVGVISPFSDGSGYHGILNNTNRIQNHITIIKHSSPDGFARGLEYKGFGSDLWGSKTVPFNACHYWAKLDQAVSDMGEPKL
jgi:hypothetical protein